MTHFLFGVNSCFQKRKKRGWGGGGGANIRFLRLKNWHPLESTINI